MVQALLAQDEAEAVAWGEDKGKARVRWVGRSPQDRAEIVYARTAQQ